MITVGIRRIVVGLAIGLLATGCGGGDEPAAATPSATSLSPGVTSATSPASTTPATTEPAGTSSSLRDLRDALGFAPITLQPSDGGGSHPILEWDPVEGAAAYWLVLRDASGDVYWAWTGFATSVRVGGGERSELNQTAALHESMTWSVAAVDASGGLLAFSDVATVSP